MSDRERRAGYAAFHAGKRRDETRAHDWLDGWQAAADCEWWGSLCAKLGATLHGFSFRYSASICWPNGQVQTLEGGLLHKLCELLDHPNSRPKARQGAAA